MERGGIHHAVRGISDFIMKTSKRVFAGIGRVFGIKLSACS